MERSLLSHLLTLQSNLFRIPFYLYEDEQRLEAFEPYSSSCDMVSPWLPMLTNTDEPLTYVLTKDLLLFGKIRDVSSDLLIIVGPVRVSKLTETTLRNIILTARPAIGIEHLSELEHFLNSCAAFSLEQFLHLVCMIHGYVNNCIVSYHNLMRRNDETTDNFINTSDNTQLQMVMALQEHTYGETSRRNNYDLEAEIMFYIRNGMTEKIKNLRLMHYEIGTLAFDSLRHYKNANIILNSLSQRAAIMGGLDPEISYQLGEIYIQKIEACQNVDSLKIIGSALLLDYCNRVNLLLHPKTNHQKINEAMHYIRENYQKRLKVEEVAEAVGLSKEYLSSKFKQVAGIALPDYINQQKIGEAKQLLHFTDMSLSEISQYLSFSSQSYFQTVFKNLTGDTPMEYRIKNKYFA
jgi:AraC-like DNA-binding protein